MNKTHPNPNLDKPNPKPGAKAMFARPSMQSCGVNDFTTFARGRHVGFTFYDFFAFNSEFSNF
jgi:hypothetical protein